MISAVCTLFEGNYHLGVAVLVNSLYNNGFSGPVYVGYRGELPSWASKATRNESLKWRNASTLKVADGLDLHFLPVDTEFHFTNYKPYFILELWGGIAKDADSIFYFDPDIVNICSWSYYEEWVQFGVALVHEIVSNDMPPNHPKRMRWRTISQAINVEVKNSMTSYINAGFFGLLKSHKGFLQLWIQLIEVAIQKSLLNKRNFSQTYDKHSILTVADQDLMNLTAMCTDVPLSEMGPEAMGFLHAGWTMLHATGSPKPWNKSYFLSIFKGRIPSAVDKQFWKYCDAPLMAHSKFKISYKIFLIHVGSFIGRFYKKN